MTTKPGKSIGRMPENVSVRLRAIATAGLAKDVDAALHGIAEEHGKMSAEEAQDWVKALKKEKRYSRDVY